MHPLRCMWFFIAFLDIRVSVEHIAGVANCAADMLSRNNVTNFLLLQSQTSHLPTPLPAPLLNIITPKARLDISQLPQSVQQYYTNGAAKSTWNTYSAGQQRYLTFGADTQRQAVPTSESTLMLFVLHLANLGLTHSTIKVYLSSIHHLHVTQGKHSQFSYIHTSLTAGAERH